MDPEIEETSWAKFTVEDGEAHWDSAGGKRYSPGKFEAVCERGDLEIICGEEPEIERLLALTKSTNEAFDTYREALIRVTGALERLAHVLVQSDLVRTEEDCETALRNANPDQWDELYAANYAYEAAKRARLEDFTIDEED